MLWESMPMSVIKSLLFTGFGLFFFFPFLVNFFWGFWGPGGGGRGGVIFWVVAMLFMARGKKNVYKELT